MSVNLTWLKPWTPTVKLWLIPTRIFHTQLAGQPVVAASVVAGHQSWDFQSVAT